MNTAHIRYAFNPRQGAMSNGTYHAVLDQPLHVGRLRRAARDAICKPRRQFWGLEPAGADARVTCSRCLFLVARHTVVVQPHRAQRPNAEPRKDVIDMSDLHPTPTQLELLRLVNDRRMVVDEYGDDREPTGVKATERMGVMQDAGWVELTETGWWITDAGRAALAAAAVDIAGSPGDLYEQLDPTGQAMFLAEDAFTRPSRLDPGLYLSDPQGHALLVGTNQRALTVLDSGNSLVEIAGVLVDSPKALEALANRLLWLAGRMRDRTGAVA